MLDHTTRASTSTFDPGAARGGTRRRVLFVCTGNAARSQMAEAWLRKYAGDHFDVQSAGTEPRASIDSLAVRAMAECSVDIADQRPKDVWLFLGEPWDFVITTCDRANENCPAFPSAQERINWSFVDPAAAEGPDGERLQTYRRVRDEILTRVRLFVGVQTRAHV